MAVSTRFFAIAALAAAGAAGVGYLALDQSQSGDAGIDGTVAASPVNVAQILSFLPDGINVTYGAESYATGSGKTTLTDLKVTFGDTDNRGFTVEKLVIAGFAGDFLQARVNGTNFDQNAVLVDYLEARNVSAFGLQSFFDEASEAYLETLGEFADGAIDDELLDLDQEIGRVDFKIERILVDDFELLPFVLNHVAPSGDGDLDLDSMHTLQDFAAYSRAIGAKEVSMTGLSTILEMEQEGQAADMRMAIPSVKIEGWRGGDYKRSSSENMTYEMAMSIPDEGEALPFEKMEMSGAIGAYAVEDVRLDAALGWLARGEMPPTTETDLMSLGTWRIQDVAFTLFDAPIYSVESSVTDMTSFHWLIPTKITHKTDNLVYDFGSLVDTISALLPNDEASEEMEIVSKGLVVLKQYDLAAPSVDISFDWLWDAERTGSAGNGPASFSVETGLTGYGTFAYNLSGALGSFEAWVKSFDGPEAPDTEEAFKSFAAENFTLAGQSLIMTDRGGNDRLFNGVSDFAKALKDDVPELAVLAAYDVATLKLLVSSSIKGGAAFGLEEVPELRDYAQALANYITQGGTFKVAIEPDDPIGFTTFSALEGIDNPKERKAFLDKIGFVLEHTTP